MVKPPQTQTMVTVVAFNREKPASAVCVVRQAPVPALLPGNVLVHVLWRPINPSDIMWCAQALSFGHAAVALAAHRLCHAISTLAISPCALFAACRASTPASSHPSFRQCPDWRVGPSKCS